MSDLVRMARVRKRLRLVLVLGCLEPGAMAFAQVRAGGEFQVNTYTTDYQASANATQAAGAFVVTWTEARQRNPLPTEHFVRGRVYEPNGEPRGAELNVNSSVPGHLGVAPAAADRAGNFVVVWDHGDRYAPFRWPVMGQRYWRSGARRGTEFQVNEATTLGYQVHAKVASDASGNFVVVWDWGGGADYWFPILGQRYDASGERRGPQFQVNDPPLPWGRGWRATVASDAAGNFIVVWEDDPQAGWPDLLARRYDATGQPVGPEFRINEPPPGRQEMPAVSSDPSGNLVVAWVGGDPSSSDIHARRFDAAGAPLGLAFRINTYTTGHQVGDYFGGSWVASDDAGNFVITWTSYGQDGSGAGIFAQRYDAGGARRGGEFQVNTHTTGDQGAATVASDGVGNLLVAWTDNSGLDGSVMGVFAQRYGGILPVNLQLDPAPSGGSDGNRVLEPGESVDVKPSWRNVNGSAQTFDGAVLRFTGPTAAGVSYDLLDAVGTYGTVADGATAQCSDCYRGGIAWNGTRPALHWDATFTERLTPDVLGQTKPWSLHVGQSFPDVPKTSLFYRDIETLLHRGVTAGCTADAYCPGSPVTRDQMAAFVLLAKEGAGYRPPVCSLPNLFADVPETSLFCDVIEELARRGVVSGCGGGNYCPAAAVTREQMPVFVQRRLEPALEPQAGTTPRRSPSTAPPTASEP
jgi:hypothetical protein